MTLSSVFSKHICDQFEEGRYLRRQGYRGRFAPSPTGPLHLGNLRTALISWLRARLAKGEWILRVDDLDTPRNRDGAIQSLQEDLHWLGLKWDGPIVLQSQRKGLYNSVLSGLKSQGKLYACRCTRKVLHELTPNDFEPFIYPSTCRDLDLSWGLQEGRLPSWRLKVKQDFLSTSGDVVVRRSDGFVAYNLSTVIDELTLGITEVVRGRDLQSVLPAQLAVMNELSSEEIKFVYTPLWLDAQGKKLAKRNGSHGIQSCREKGMTAEKIIGFLAASLSLVNEGAELSSQELLSDLLRAKQDLSSILN